MFCCDSLAGGLLDELLCHVSERNHAHGLPYSETNTRSDTTVQTLETVLLVDVGEGVADCHLLGSVRVLGLGLHFYAHDFDRLVPRAETSTKGRGKNSLGCAELRLWVFFASELTNTVLSAGKLAHHHHSSSLCAAHLRDSAETES